MPKKVQNVIINSQKSLDISMALIAPRDAINPDITGIILIS
jgi:hypothetical protein